MIYMGFSWVNVHSSHAANAHLHHVWGPCAAELREMRSIGQRTDPIIHTVVHECSDNKMCYVSLRALHHSLINTNFA